MAKRKEGRKEGRKEERKKRKEAWVATLHRSKCEFSIANIINAYWQNFEFDPKNMSFFLTLKYSRPGAIVCFLYDYYFFLIK